MKICDFIDDCTLCCCEEKPALLDGLDNESRKFLYEGRREIKYKKGETILKQHTNVSHIVCVRTGFAKVYSEGANGKNLVHKILMPGEMIGGMGLFVDETHHTSTMALTDVECCLIDANKFKALLEKNHEFCLTLIKRINKFAVHTSQRMLNLTNKTMFERVAETILYLSDQIYKSDVFDVDLSRQDIADLCSLSKESVIRIMKDMKEQNVLSIDRNHFEILDKNKLISISKSIY